MSVSIHLLDPLRSLRDRGISLHRHVAPSMGSIVFVAICAVLAVLAPGRSLDAVALVLTVALAAAAAVVPFSVRGSTVSAIQLAHVPLWFAAPAAALPVLAAAITWVTFSRGDGDGDSDGGSRAGSALRAGLAACGPAVLLALLGEPPASMGLLGFVVAAAGAQAVILGALASLSFDRLPVRAFAPVGHPVAGRIGADVGLAPLGLVVAVSMHVATWSLLGVVPVVVLLERLSRERDLRADQARCLAEAYRGTASLMGDVLEADDEYTGGEHTDGVVEMAAGVGRVLGLDAARMQTLELGALLHDVGKLRVPNEIINKPGRLTEEEWVVMKRHPAFGEAMLLRVGGALAEAAPLVRGHHERFGGGGYPDGLVGAQIPLEARIIAVCDSFSAMTTDRSYRKGMGQAEAVAELRRCTPDQFDPAVVAAFETLLGDLHREGLRVAAEAHPAYGTTGSVAEDAVPVAA